MPFFVQVRRSGSGELQVEASKSTSVLLAEDNIINLRVSWGCSESAVSAMAGNPAVLFRQLTSVWLCTISLCSPS